MSLNDKVREYTDQLNQKGLLRVRQVSLPAHVSFIHFDSNDYLSLSGNKDIAQAYQQGFSRYPAGSGASMLLSGYHSNHQAIEKAFADLLNVDECILFSSGYTANLAVAALLGAIKAHCIIDKNVHASLYDGLNLAGVNYSRYRHNNMDDLSHKLDSTPSLSALVTEGVFSMSGQIAPLSTLASMCVPRNMELIVDEAHSFGILGELGAGAIDHHGLTQSHVPLRIIPLGKAFSAQGAIVGGRREWIYALLQAGRSIIYSTAISPALSYGLLKTLDIVTSAEERRHHLRQLVYLFKDHIKDSPLKWAQSDTPIQQLHLGCPHLSLYYANELKKHGIYCSAIRTPTVNIQSTGLRVLLNYQHNETQIKYFFNTINHIYEITH